MQWNEAQRRAIESESASILVSAAAGSGKTAVLVERIKRLLIEKNIPLSAMLIVTFTNAAAAEMRHKIVNSLTDELEKRDSAFLREQAAGIYRASISTFHAFAMDVIKRYYFKADLPPGLKICDDAQRSLLRGEAADELFARRLDEDYERFADFLDHYSGGKNEDGVKESMIFNVYDAVRVRPDAFDWLREKTALLSKPGDEILKSGIGDEMKKDIGAALMRIRELLGFAADILMKGGAYAYIKYIEGDIAGVDALLESVDSDSAEMLIDKINAFKFKRFAVRKEEDKAPYRLIEDRVSAARDRAKKIMTAGIQSLYAKRPLAEYIADINATAEHAEYLYELILDFHEVFARKKIEKGLMDFADIEHYALRILCDEEAAEEYIQRFKYIFIDEYQDNNIMQETLIGKINKGNNIFMVGDVKQSIYKFRLAEPELFAEKYRLFGDGDLPDCERIDLNLNYRSEASVIEAVNSVFSSLMTDAEAGISYDENAALKQGLEIDDEERYSRAAEFYIVDDSRAAAGDSVASAGAAAASGAQDAALGETAGIANASEDAEPNDISDGYSVIADMKKTELEALAAADIVRRELYDDDGGRRVFFDVKLGREREVRLRDIVILLRSARTQADVFRRVLEDRGLPAFVSTGEGYFDTIEIETFMNLLRVIDNRRRDVALLSVMYSPIFGFTTDELMDIRLAAPAKSYCDAVFIYAGSGGADSEPAVSGDANGCGRQGADGGCDKLAAKCRKLLEQIEDWRESAAYMPLDEFIWMLMKESGYYNYAGALPGGLQRQANLRALADKALDFQNTQLRGLRGFINYAEHLKRVVGVGQVKLIGESEDVLRLMTVHKSKGLEFPIVIAAGLGKRFVAERGAPIKIHKDIGVGLWWVAPLAGIYKKTLIQSVIERKKAREDLSEEIRVLYVAFTRAMHKLILLGSAEGGLERLHDSEILADGKSYMQLLMPVVDKTKIVVKGISRADLALSGERNEGRQGDAIRTLFTGEHAKAYAGLPFAAEIERRLSFEYPYKEATALKSKYSVSEVVKETVFAADDEMMDAPAIPKFMEDARKLSAAEKGSVIHKVMELMDFHKARENIDEISYFDTMLKNMTEDGILTDEEVQTVDRTKLVRFLKSDICRRAVESGSLKKEVPFVLKKRLKGEEVLIQGVIDCFFKENIEYGKRGEDAFILLDYKTGRIAAQSGTAGKSLVDYAAERYGYQLEIYSEALERIHGVKVAEAHIYMLDEGEDIIVKIP
ncbi:MAG: UvrD-helicase domain-containing protein [Clostridiales Family XIII bacterium]|jgi:ATP-dependent helicase/nuclease subunit A|nr:UvrD-helicase domain-containing protein [Clostridiales Family XIII bacterium]